MGGKNDTFYLYIHNTDTCAAQAKNKLHLTKYIFSKLITFMLLIPDKKKSLIYQHNIHAPII
jgi:hypothetical protein